MVVALPTTSRRAQPLRDAPGCQFEQLIDLCGVDYSDYRERRLGRPALLRGRRTCCRSA